MFLNTAVWIKVMLAILVAFVVSIALTPFVKRLAVKVGAGQGKAAVQRDVGMHRPVAEQLARRQANAHSAGRVTAGRADHHGPENIK